MRMYFLLLTLAHIHADDYFRIQAAQLTTYTNQSLMQVTQRKAPPLQPGQMLLILPGRPIKTKSMQIERQSIKT